MTAELQPNTPAPAQAIPPQSYGQIFGRFLRFGLLAWGGPIAQIAMIKQELVVEEQWISLERFNRVLAVYQALPGPEAHELCVYFGMLARGRIGAALAGLGFMLPGFLLMLALSWVYVAYGLTSALFGALLFGFKPAVAALLVRGTHRIGQHALTNRWLWGIAVAAGVATWLGLSFSMVLLVAGLSYTVIKRGMAGLPSAHALLAPLLAPAAALIAPSALTLFGYGLRTGLLTFGGAYTAIPFLQHDAVEAGRWMTNGQFVDGLALSGILPAPLIIFSTFVGYLGAGPLGALAMTAGVFLPAFLFTILGHHFFERLVENSTTHAFLDGITAGVVGLIVVTSGSIIWAARPPELAQLMLAIAIFALSLAVLYRWKSRLSTPVVVLGSGALGLLAQLI